MIKHVFSQEMMQEREKQLIVALLNCAGVCYDINITQDRILGCPIQIIDGRPYPILEQIGKEENCSYTEIIEYWKNVMPEEECEAFLMYSDIERIKARYAAGETIQKHRFKTFDVMGNPMLAEQVIQLYEDNTTGDLLGLVYISNKNEQETLREKEEMYAEKYLEALDAVLLMETVSTHIPGGYHRCSVSDGFKLEFISESFLEVVGWTRHEIENTLNNEFLNVVAPEDRDFFMSHEPMLAKDGRIDLVYRIHRSDGARRWVKDSTIRMEQGEKIFYQCTLADITDNVEMLNRERAKAEASSQAKSTFLFNTSHDIRTPMNAIQGFARMISENYDQPEFVKETVQKIMQSSDTLMKLLNDVLELSRIEQGKDNIDEQPLNMEEHVEKLYEMFAVEMKDAEINFVMENDIKHPYVLGDNLKLSRIALNLLSNAKKFTPKNGTVTFGVKEVGMKDGRAVYRLSVKDTGIGMSKDFQSRAFEQFERARSSTESGVVGSGLGLAITKKLCDLMGGEYQLVSDLGKGTEITVAVPLTLAKEHASLEEEELTSKDFSGKRVLLVEDNDFNREIARYILEGMNMVVEEAENGSICVNKMLQAEPGYYDLVLMDVQMPVMDGLKATREIRNISDEAKASTPIIAMTANAFVEDQQKCLEAGMNAHLSKPLEIEALLETFADILRKKDV